mgnify:CR=1 FL=1
MAAIPDICYANSGMTVLELNEGARLIADRRHPSSRT